ncbi:MAG: DUF937 domain-containing protein [Lewinella sp.]
MANILDGLMGMITPELMGNISDKLGEDKGGISSALGGLIPSILGGLVNKAEAGGDGFGPIFDLIKNQGGNFDRGSLINRLGSGSLAQNDPRDIGGGLLGSVLGSKTGGLIDAVSEMSGIGKKSSSSLLGMAAPFIMSFLAKKIKGEKMDVGGLVSMLLGQKSSIMGAIPAVLGSVLGFGGSNSSSMASTANAVKTGATTAAAAATSKVDTGGGMGFMKWLLPLLAVLVLGYFGLKSCGSDVQASLDNAGDAVSTAAADAAAKAESMANDAAAATSDAMTSMTETANGLWERALPGGVKIEANKEGVEYTLIDFIESDKAVDKETWFNFDALKFNTAKADLDTDYSMRQIDNMVAVLKAYPNVKLKIGGYTDSDGGDAANMSLSQKRADVVKNAIVSKGIAADRLDAEGYGEQHPACPANDTPECKAQNRRIAARVTAK